MALGPPCGPQLPTFPPTLVQSEMFLLFRTSKRAIAHSITYQTVVKHHVPDHALMELMV